MVRFKNYLYPGGTLLRLLRFYIKRDGTPLFPKEIVCEESLQYNEKDELSIDNITICNNEVIQKLFRTLKKYENDISVFIHGSWADGTNNSFSDIDNFIIINENKFTNNKLKSLIQILNKIDMKMCRIDPLQHHGHWIVLKGDLLNYDNSYIPLFILKNAKIVVGNKNFDFFLNTSELEKRKKKNLLATINSIRNNGELFLEGKMNVYQFKAFISSISLIPPLIFQHKNIELSKKEAISRADEVFSIEAHKVMMWATQIRSNWKEINNKISFKLFRLLPILFFNPFVWRKFAFRFSPKIPQKEVRNMSIIEFDKIKLECFIKECENYVFEK